MYKTMYGITACIGYYLRKKQHNIVQQIDIPFYTTKSFVLIPHGSDWLAPLDRIKLEIIGVLYRKAIDYIRPE